MRWENWEEAGYASVWDGTSLKLVLCPTCSALVSDRGENVFNHWRWHEDLNDKIYGYEED